MGKHSFLKTQACDPLFRKMSSEGFNTHLWGFQEIDGKTFIFRENLGM